jgi:hypothetical protein
MREHTTETNQTTRINRLLAALSRGVQSSEGPASSVSSRVWLAAAIK